MTPSSTSEGLAPLYSTLMVMVSKLVSGNTSSFMVQAVITPARIKKIISRFAATWFCANQAMIRFIA